VSGVDAPASNGVLTGLITRSRRTLWRQTSGGVVVLSLGSAHPLRLDAMGAVIWGELERGTSLDDLLCTLADRYDVEPALVRPGVEEVLTALDEAAALAVVVR
jgi:coenzyme PQQ synthesis protein D (PqqD)